MRGVCIGVSCTCGKPAVAHGLCAICYQREDRKRNPEKHKRRTYQLRDRRKAWLLKHKDKPCMDCNQRFPHYVMEFDHREGTLKVASMSRMLKTHSSIKSLELEMAKCDLVCANCHAVRTYERVNRGKHKSS